MHEGKKKEEKKERKSIELHWARVCENGYTGISINYIYRYIAVGRSTTLPISILVFAKRAFGRHTSSGFKVIELAH